MGYTEPTKSHRFSGADSELFRAAWDAVPEAMILSDRDGIILEVNAACLELYAFTREELIGQNITLMYAEEVGDYFLQRYRYFFETQSIPRKVESTLARRRGTELAVDIRLAFLYEGGEPTALLTIVRDMTQFKRNEIALRDSQERYQSLIHNLPNGSILLFDRNFTILVSDGATFTTRGVDPTYYIGKTIYEAYDPEVLKQVAPAYEATLRGETSVLEITARDGVYEVQHAPVIDRDGNITGGMVLSQDITSRKQTEMDLARLAAIVQSSNDSIVSKALDGTILTWNDGAQHLYGYTATEAVGRNITILEPPEHKDEIATILKRIKRGERIEEYRTVRVKKDGTRLVVSLTISPIRDPAGHIIGASAISRDITEREREEERQKFLASASETLASSLDYDTTLATVAQLAVPHIADWCMVHLLAEDGTLNEVALAHADPGKIQWVEELRDRYASTPDENSGAAQVVRTGQTQFIAEITDEMLRAAVQDPELLKILRELELRSTMTVPLTVHGRTLGAIAFACSGTSSRYTEADLALAEELARRAAIAVDNARLYHSAQRLNEELEQRVKERTIELESSNRELEAFSYSVSHDLRAPVSHITGFAELIQRRSGDTLDEKDRRYLNHIAESAAGMGVMIDDLLSLSRVGRTDLRKSLFDMQGLVQEVITDFDRETTTRDIEWRVEPLPVVRADRSLLRLAWVNLISNAVKYTSTRPKAEVEIGHMLNDNEIVFYIRDNGVGFDMKYVEKLFGVFQRLHSAVDFEGTGIGLANIRRIISRHGGKTWAEGSTGEGATFYFSLPNLEEKE